MNLKTILKHLISINSISNEAQLAKFIENYIKSLHLPNLNFEKQPIWDWNRYNLIVKNTDNPELILAWHMDTVPVSDKNQLNPFEKNWKIYWRWAVDMKWWLAIILDLLPTLVKNNKKFWLLFYCDEEYYFKWMKTFQNYLRQNPINPKLVIIPEPTDEKIILNFRGITEFELKIRWKSAHSARKHFGKSAIEWIFKFSKDLEKFFNSKQKVFESSVNLAGIKWWILSNEKIIWKWNQVPDFAEAMVEVRIWSKISQKEFENFIKTWFKDKSYKLEELKINFYLDWLLQPELESKYKIFAEIDDGKNFWYSDIAMIKQILPSADCLLLWPWPKSKAHQENEYVEIESLERVKGKIRRIITEDLKDLLPQII